MTTVGHQASGTTMAASAALGLALVAGMAFAAARGLSADPAVESVGALLVILGAAALAGAAISVVASVVGFVRRARTRRSGVRQAVLVVASVVAVTAVVLLFPLFGSGGASA